MTTAEHTKEPWTDASFRRTRLGLISKEPNLSTEHAAIKCRVLTEDNFARAKICVNALAGAEEPEKVVEAARNAIRIALAIAGHFVTNPYSREPWLVEHEETLRKAEKLLGGKS